MSFHRALLLCTLCLALFGPGLAAAAQGEDGATPAAQLDEPGGYLAYTEPHPLEGVSVWGALARSVMALGIVLALLGGGVLFLRRYMPGITGGGGAHPVRVLGRISLSPKQSVYLLHVAGRVLLVGSGGGQLTTLSEVTDPDEVAQLVESLPATGAAVGAPFGGLLRRRLEDAHGMRGATPAAGPEVPLDAIRRQIASLRAIARRESP